MRDWLGAFPHERFLHEHYQKRPLAQPSTTFGARRSLDWRAMDRLLACDPAADVLVVAGGELLAVPPPRSLAELRACFRRGVGVCIRHCERNLSELARLAATIEAQLPGTAQIQVFATPGGTHGFGWHYDDEEVFIAQLAGVKTYTFRENTVVSAPAAPREFTRLVEERSPLCTATLAAGDFLYLPARWWHMAVSVKASLSISLGVGPAPSSRAEGSCRA